MYRRLRPILGRTGRNWRCSPLSSGMSLGSLTAIDRSLKCSSILTLNLACHLPGLVWRVVRLSDSALVLGQVIKDGHCGKRPKDPPMNFGRQGFELAATAKRSLDILALGRTVDKGPHGRDPHCRRPETLLRDMRCHSAIQELTIVCGGACAGRRHVLKPANWRN